MVLFEDVEIGKKLGSGAMGTVYLAVDKKGVEYAAKIEKIAKKDIEESYASPIWREIDFAKTMGCKYPNHFMKLHDYRILDECKHVQEISFDIDDLPEKYRKFYKERRDSNHCFQTLYSIVDTDLMNLLSSNTFGKNEMIDIFTQVAYVIYLMNKEGYLHADFHVGNIGIKYTDKKFIDILGVKVKTHGMLVQAIDYGLVLHRKFILTEDETSKIQNTTDILPLFSALIEFDEFYKKFDITNWSVFYSMDISNYDQAIIDSIIDNKEHDGENYDLLSRISYILIFYDKYEKNFVKDLETPITPKLFLPGKDILFMIKHVMDVKRILNHLLEYN